MDEETADLDDEGLSTDYDVVIYGTGLVESIVSCACAKIGKSVLHLDAHDHYGHESNSLPLLDFLSNSRANFESTKSVEWLDGGTSEAMALESVDGDASTTAIPLKSHMQSPENESGENGDTTSIGKSENSHISKVIDFADLQCSEYTCPQPPRMHSKRASEGYHPACFGYVMDRHPSNDQGTGDTSTGKGVGDGSTGGNEKGDSGKDIHPAFSGYSPTHTLTPNRARHLSRYFSLDHAFTLLQGTGPGVETIVASDVSRYLEFQSMDHLYILPRESTDNGIKRAQSSSTNGNANSNRSTSGGGSTSKDSGSASRGGYGPAPSFLAVPSSKHDVFTTTLLRGLEKRSFMKFLQHTLDRGELLSGQDALTLNERDMSMGRALRRAQNDNNSTLAELTQHDTLPLAQYMESLKMSHMLQDIVVHALCFHVYDCRQESNEGSGDSTLSTARALDVLYSNINSIGRYGKTPFLLTLYGSGEVGQAFCRMAAVYGGTFVLRRGVRSIHRVADDGRKNNDGDNNGDSGREKEKDKEGGGKEREKREYSIVDSRGISRTCSHLLLNAAYCPYPSYTPHLVLTRVSVLDRYILPARKGAVGVLPPGSGGVGNVAAVYVIEVDHNGSIACERGVLVHCSTVVKREDIVREGEGVRECAEMMDRAMQLLLASASGNDDDGSDGGRKVRELCYSTALRPCYDIAAMQSHYSATTINDGNGDGDGGGSHIYVAGEGGHSLHSNGAFQEAKRVFMQMYPSEEWMPRTEQDEAHDNNEEEEETDLREMYDQAMGGKEEGGEKEESKESSDDM